MSNSQSFQWPSNVHDVCSSFEESHVNNNFLRFHFIVGILTKSFLIPGTWQIASPFSGLVMYMTFAPPLKKVMSTSISFYFIWNIEPGSSVSSVWLCTTRNLVQSPFSIKLRCFGTACFRR